MNLPPRILLPAALLLFCGCKSTTAEGEIAKAQKKAAKEQSKLDKAVGKEAAPGVDVDFLLGMSFDEALAISNGSGRVPGVAQVAADKVEVVKSTADGVARRLRAEGHVFVEMLSGGDVATALSQEAYITEDEVILRGKPVVKRGVALLEGLSGKTVFFIQGNQIRALGQHRVKNGPTMPLTPDESAALMATMRQGRDTDGEAPSPRLPEVGPWREGPNPLLPPLDDTAVPEEVREEVRRSQGRKGGG